MAQHSVVVPGRSAWAGGAGQLEVEGGPNVLLIDRQPLFLAALGTLLTAPPVRARVQVAHDTDAGLEIALRGDRASRLLRGQVGTDPSC
jgi:hypothetical protein